jgi:hypothetical protein
MSGPYTERPELEQHEPFGELPPKWSQPASGQSPESMGWIAPLSSRPLIEHPVAAFLSELADAIADGAAGEIYALTWQPAGRVVMQLEPEPDQNPLTALRWWAGRLGATSVCVAHNWHNGCDRYSVDESFATGRLEVFTVARADRPGGTSFIPVDQLDRGFDDPPPAPNTGRWEARDLDGEPIRRGDREEPDTMTPGMPDPCQPIGCDNGRHLPGCPFADRDQEEPDTEHGRPERCPLRDGAGRQCMFPRGHDGGGEVIHEAPATAGGSVSWHASDLPTEGAGID